MRIQANGRCAAGFESVVGAFESNFEDQDEVGAALCVYVDGQAVLDVWAGWADREAQRPWQRDTSAVVFSTTKGVAAICVHLLLERGLLDLDAPIAAYWPEFAAAGKAKLPLRWMLSHRLGLPIVEADLSRAEVFAHDPVARALAAQAPSWPPGSKHGYHVRTYGWMLAEIVRRVTGLTIGAFLAREVAAPLGLDFHIGLPASEEERVAKLYMAPLPTDPTQLEIIERFMGPGTLMNRAFNQPGDLAYGEVWNTRDLHAAEIPSSNGIGTARALARLYASCVGSVDGVRTLRPETVERAVQLQSEGRDKVLLIPTTFALGFMLPPSLGLDCPTSCFGHPGAGGSLAFADTERRVSFAYVMNQMKLGLTGDDRSRRIVAALYRTLAGASVGNS